MIWKRFAFYEAADGGEKNSQKRRKGMKNVSPAEENHDSDSFPFREYCEGICCRGVNYCINSKRFSLRRAFNYLAELLCALIKNNCGKCSRPAPEDFFLAEIVALCSLLKCLSRS